MTLLLIVLIAAPLAKHIPLATLSAILLIVAINMGEWEGFVTLRKYPASDSAVLAMTFLLTVIFDLIVEVEAGMFIAILFKSTKWIAARCMPLNIYTANCTGIANTLSSAAPIPSHIY